MQELAKIDNQSLFNLITNGDCSKLSADQKLQYYKARCDAAGLDPRCQPFQYIKLQGKEVLYALKSCTDQLSASRRLSAIVVKEEILFEGSIYKVTAKVKEEGCARETDDNGCVTIKGLLGDQLCNAIMKATTKAKRRAILSHCGLGMLDETELETIPNVETSNEAPLALVQKEVVQPVSELESPKTVAAKAKASDPLQNKYLNGKWRNVVNFYAKKDSPIKGKTLGQIEALSDGLATLHRLASTFKPSPNPKTGVISGESYDLRDALDAFETERQIEKESGIQVSPEDQEKYARKQEQDDMFEEEQSWDAEPLSNK